MKLFCWCGALEQYAPPVILLLLVLTFIIGTIGKLLGWSDPAAPTISPPAPEEPPVEEKKRRKTHGGVERRSSLTKEETAAAPSAPTIIVRNEVVPRENATKTLSKKDVSIEMVDQTKKTTKDSTQKKAKDPKSSSTADSTVKLSYTDLASSASGPKKRTKPKATTEPRNSVDLEPSFLEEERLSRPRPTRERSSSKERKGRNGTPTISYTANKGNPKGTPIPAAPFNDKEEEPRNSSSPRVIVKNTSKAPKDMTRTNSPVRTRSPGPRKTTSGTGTGSASLLDSNDRTSSNLDDKGTKAKRTTSPPRTRTPPKRPTSPVRNRNSGGETEKTRWGGVQTDKSPAGPAMVIRAQSPMRPTSTDLDADALEGGQEETL